MEAFELPDLPGRGIGWNIRTGEKVEAELDAMIGRRHDARVKSEGERRAEEIWRESERRHDARRQSENAAAWYVYLMASADSIERTASKIAAGKRAQAARLMTGGHEPKGAWDG